MSPAGQINLMYMIGASVLLVLSVPLILGKIPPNPIYGFRTAKTRSDPKIWYPVNGALGKGLLGAALAILATTGALWALGDGLSTNQVALTDLAVTAVAVVAAIGYAARVYARS